MELFHVDLHGHCEEGEELTKADTDNVLPEDDFAPGADIVRDRFPDGLTEYGVQCVLADIDTHPDPAAITREWIFEFIRQSNYGHYVPSRFQAIKAYETPKAARNFVQRNYPPGVYEVYIVEPEDPSGPYYTGHLQGSTVPAMMDHAQSYWEGIPYKEGEREYLSTLPMNIGDHVETIELE